MKRKKYDYLKDEYPEYISLDQMYQICGIAKRTALYLVKHGIVPATDNGQRTWRYKIALDDVIRYLRRKEQWGSMIPPGAVSSRWKSNKNPNAKKMCYADILNIGSAHVLKEYFAYIYTDYPDLLTIIDVTEMTGLSKKSVLTLIRNGDLKALTSNTKYLIPKEYLLTYVSSWKYCDSHCNSQHFQRVLGAFEIWVQKRSGHK